MRARFKIGTHRACRIQNEGAFVWRALACGGGPLSASMNEPMRDTTRVVRVFTARNVGECSGRGATCIIMGETSRVAVIQTMTSVGRARARAGGGRSRDCRHPFGKSPPLRVRLPHDKKNRSDLDPAVKTARATGGVRSSSTSRGLAPYAVEPRLSRIRSRLDSTGPGDPLGSLDLSGQRHICRTEASPNEDPASIILFPHVPSTSKLAGIVLYYIAISLLTTT